MVQAPSLTVLRALKNLATTGNVSRTARALGLTQSAVSRAIANYENTIGLSLLQREARPLTLTEAGEIVVASAAEVDRSLATLNEQLLAVRQNETGFVRIGSFGPTASTFILPDLLPRFARTRPSIAVSIHEAPDDTTREEVSKGLTDVAVLSEPVEDFDALPIATDQLVALVRWDNTISSWPAVAPDNLAGSPFIMTLGGSEPAILDWFRQGGVQPDVRHRTQQTHSILALVRSGLGQAIVARFALPPELQGVSCIPLVPSSEREIFLVKKTGTPRSPAVTAFWDFARSSTL